MVKPVKSVLLVDLDGLSRGLAAAGGRQVDKRLAERIDAWSGAIENGELLEPAGTSRAIVTRRCYVSVAGADKAREAFAPAGFEIVECDDHAQAVLCLAMDAMDAAADTEDEMDFVLLTAVPDLTPLVERLHARGHRVAVYVDEETAADYQAAVDMTIPAGDLVALLADNEVPATATPPAERSKIEAFAREVHAATNIPMFSPKTFADLFRFLASEVTEHGYHFSGTAKAVAARLADAGRNVTSRQVVFVVKGLALKGHVFSTSDTAEHLAEVFLEQARYLISGAGIRLDADREALLTAWIAAPAARPAKATPASQPTARSRPARKPAPERRPVTPEAAKPASRKPPSRKWQSRRHRRAYRSVPDRPSCRPSRRLRRRNRRSPPDRPPTSGRRSPRASPRRRR